MRAQDFGIDDFRAALGRDRFLLTDRQSRRTAIDHGVAFTGTAGDSLEVLCDRFRSIEATESPGLETLELFAADSGQYPGLTVVWRHGPCTSLVLHARTDDDHLQLEYRVTRFGFFFPGDQVVFRPTQRMLSFESPESSGLERLIGKTATVMAVRGGYQLETDHMDGTYTAMAFELVESSNSLDGVVRRRDPNPFGFTLVESLAAI